MLICLIALVAASIHAFVAGLAEQATPNPVTHPSTLELALIAAGTLAVYAAVKRSFWPRTRAADHRMPSIPVDASTTESTSTQQSRGAA